MDQFGNIYPEIGGVARAIKSKAECKRSSLQKQWLTEAGNNKDIVGALALRGEHTILYGAQQRFYR